MRAATRVDPTFAEAWHYLGDLLDEQGRSNAAIECLRTALRIAPDYADAKSANLIWSRGRKINWGPFMSSLISRGTFAKFLTDRRFSVRVWERLQRRSRRRQGAARAIRVALPRMSQSRPDLAGSAVLWYPCGAISWGRHLRTESRHLDAALRAARTEKHH